MLGLSFLVKRGRCGLHCISVPRGHSLQGGHHAATMTWLVVAHLPCLSAELFIFHNHPNIVSHIHPLGHRRPIQGRQRTSSLGLLLSYLIRSLLRPVQGTTAFQSLGQGRIPARFITIEADRLKPARIQIVDSKPDRQSQAGYDPDGQIYHNRYRTARSRGRENLETL